MISITLCVGMLTGCSRSVPVAYESMSDNTSFLLFQGESGRAVSFAANLCIGDADVAMEDFALEKVSAAGLFDLNAAEVLYAEDMHTKLYPASLTKILTAYVAIKYGSLDQKLVATNAVNIMEPGATLAGIVSGDSMTLEQALHLMLICSANDVANLIAENISGSVEDFVDLMNEEAAKLGATNSHFVNPHGLHDPDHYTTVYDLYLIFKEAIKYDAFTQIINQTAYSTTYQDKYGNAKNISVSTTNAFFRKQYEVPENVTILGGKTGTTDEAGSCLALYVKDTAGNPYLGIILHGDSKDDLYAQMKKLLEQINKK